MLLTISGVQCIAFNFGKWEHKEHVNPHAVDCHAHAHVIFTPEGQQALAKVFDIFVGRTDPPPDYVIHDCLEVERDRVLATAVFSIINKINTLEKTMASLSDDIAYIRKRFEQDSKERKKTDDD
jgi:hypothetical protein